MSDNKQSSEEMIFWGATGQAKVLRECFNNSMKLIALFDNNNNIVSPFEDVPLYYGENGFKEWFLSQRKDMTIGFLVAIGGSYGRERLEIQAYLESYSLKPLVARHRTAFLAESVTIGLGSQILANSSVCVETFIGRGCIINTGAIVDHECHIDDGVHIGPGARLAGCVKVERFSMIGMGAVVLPRIRIGEGAIVGAGSIVTKDVPPHTVVIGNPAKFHRKIPQDGNL